jgi:hypothetical protein
MGQHPYETNSKTNRHKIAIIINRGNIASKQLPCVLHLTQLKLKKWKLYLMKGEYLT